MSDEPIRTNEYWRDKLSPEEYRICREKGTERAFSGELLDNKANGEYVCKCCGMSLFLSNTKYESGCGWPSFYAPLEEGKIDEHRDVSLAMERIEIVCANCDAHLGHVFNDGPQPTGLRYCVNSASLDFKSEEGE